MAVVVEKSKVAVSLGPFGTVAASSSQRYSSRCWSGWDSKWRCRHRRRSAHRVKALEPWHRTQWEISWRESCLWRPLGVKRIRDDYGTTVSVRSFPSPRWASAIQIVRPRESTAERQPQLQPALLRLSAMISQYFTHTMSDNLSGMCQEAPARGRVQKNHDSTSCRAVRPHPLFQTNCLWGNDCAGSTVRRGGYPSRANFINTGLG